jgi:nickel-type superoxide dismutase maturation protease
MARQPAGPRRLFVVLGIAATVAVGAAIRRWLDAVEVRGRSMTPALMPGDRLLVEAWSFAHRRPRPGEVVLAPDPRQPGRELVKRVAAVDAGAALLELRGDAARESTDSRAFGAVAIDAVHWRVVARYWPPLRPRRWEALISSAEDPTPMAPRSRRIAAGDPLTRS